MSGAARPAFTLPVRVYYEDTDSAGVVYYANYLRFLERARTEWLRALGFEQDRLREEAGVLFAVSRLAVDYRRPARFNDLLDVGARIRRAGRASLEFDQSIHRRGGELLVSARVRVACVDAERLKPCPIPYSILAELSP